MWWAGKRAAARTAAIAYVGEGAVRLALGGTLLLAAAVEGREAALAALSAAVRDLPRGTRLRVAVGGAICRPYLMPAVEGAVGDADWTAIAASLVEDSTGLPADSRVWLDGGQTSPRLAVAIDAAWLRGIEAVGGRMLESVRPWWALAIEASRTETASSVDLAGVAVADNDSLVLLLAEGETYRVAQAYGLDGEPADSVLSRVLVTHDVEARAVALMRLDMGALPGQTVDERLPFRSGASS